MFKAGHGAMDIAPVARAAEARGFGSLWVQDHVASPVDFAELTSGLSVLCNCSAKDKFITTFTIHDADGDGLLQPDEVQHFMTSVFRGERAKRSERASLEEDKHTRDESTPAKWLQTC